MTNEELVMEYRETGNEDALTEICRKNKGLVGMVVKNLWPYYCSNEGAKKTSIIESDDLMQYGYIGLLKAVRVYDPDKGSFANIAVWWIRQEILRSMDNNEHTIRMSADTRNKLVKLQRFRRSFVNEYGFEPRIEEIVSNLLSTLLNPPSLIFMKYRRDSRKNCEKRRQNLVTFQGKFQFFRLNSSTPGSRRGMHLENEVFCEKRSRLL